ncbi:MAG: hypothetical protein FRX49_06108 [Trebouxia sp. A1-2]|nr:MAG: hypothetical protein FRX49_06108 [Trebouxia sp. A1-2]
MQLAQEGEGDEGWGAGGGAEWVSGDGGRPCRGNAGTPWQKPTHCQAATMTAVRLTTSLKKSRETQADQHNACQEHSMTGRHTNLAAARDGRVKQSYLPKIDSCAITQLTTKVPKLVTSIAVRCSL